MAKKMFEVEIRNNEPKGYETAVSLRMPATWSEFHDALQKARIKDGRSCGNELLYVGYDGLQRGMIGRNINLYDLNLLAQRLTALTPEENTGMEALLAMEWSRRRGPVSLEHLINLTYNTDVCCLAPQVSNLQELGAFLYENEMLSKEAMALLDTTEEDSEFRASLLKLLGEQHKEDHGGVFTKRGYAELGGEIRPVYAYQPGETTYFQRSGAPVVLEVRKGFFNDPQYDNDKTAILNLPAILHRAPVDVQIARVDLRVDHAVLSEGRALVLTLLAVVELDHEEAVDLLDLSHAAVIPFCPAIFRPGGAVPGDALPGVSA